MASAEKTQPMQDEALKWLDGRDDYGGRHFLRACADRRVANVSNSGGAAY
jgi:hypothetical protein